MQFQWSASASLKRRPVNSDTMATVPRSPATQSFYEAGHVLDDDHLVLGDLGRGLLAHNVTAHHAVSCGVAQGLTEDAMGMTDGSGGYTTLPRTASAVSQCCVPCLDVERPKLLQ